MVSGTGEGKIGSLMNIELPFTRWKSSEFSCTTAWIYLILLHYILQMVKIVNFMLCNLCVFVCVCVCACVLSPDQYFAIPWTGALQAPGSVEFPRQIYWSGLPFPTPRDLPNPGIEPVSPALAGRCFTTAPHGKPFCMLYPYFFLFFYFTILHWFCHTSTWVHHRHFIPI